MATSTTREPDGKIVEFPQPENTLEERARRLRVEVERMAWLAPGEWRLYADDAVLKYGIPPANLKAMVEATIKANEKAAREGKDEERHQERRAERQQNRARQDAERARKERERTDKQAAREAARKQNEKDQAFAKLVDLPSIEHEARLAALAKRLGEELELLRDEFAVYVETEDAIKRSRDAEPWPEAIDTHALLTDLEAQIRRYIFMHDDAAIAIALWTMFAWIHSVAVHSPNLDVTSPVPDCGKTTLLGVLSYLTPRPYKVVEITCGNLHRIVDRHHPTLFVDEADNLLLQKELRAILNASWTKGTKVPRMTNGQLHEYDVFCPKVICGKSLVMADTTATRGILIKLWPKLPDEEVDDFDHEDNAEFVVLRRKLTRWTQDNIARLKAARPIMPTGFDNRLAKNWKLLFAIADLADGDYPQRARSAAIKLSHKRLAPSEGLRLFEVLDPMVRNRDVIPSAEIIERLTAAEDSEWREYGRGRKPISQRGLALLLEQFDIGPPGVVHPSGRSHDSPRGYRCDQIRAVIARLPPQAHKRTPKPKKPRKKP